jgi:hypothetical protein
MNKDGTRVPTDGLISRRGPSPFYQDQRDRLATTATTFTADWVRVDLAGVTQQYQRHHQTKQQEPGHSGVSQLQ